MSIRPPRLQKHCHHITLRTIHIISMFRRYRRSAIARIILKICRSCHTRYLILAREMMTFARQEHMAHKEVDTRPPLAEYYTIDFRDLRRQMKYFID